DGSTAKLWALRGALIQLRHPAVNEVAQTFTSSVDEALEALGPARVAQLPERLRLDLPDALSRHFEVLPHLLERVVALLSDAETHAQDLFLSGRERGQHFARLLREVHVDDRLGRADDVLVLDEVAEVAVLLLADRRLEGDRLLGELEDLAHPLEGHLHLLGDLLGMRLAPDLLDQVAAGANQLVDRLDHVHRDANRPRLVGDRSSDRLPDPPRGVGGELEAAAVLEFVHRLHQADVPLLDQVEELQAAVGVLLGDGDHQPQVGLDEFLLGALGPLLAVDHLLVGAAELLDALLHAAGLPLELVAELGVDERVADAASRALDQPLQVFELVLADADLGQSRGHLPVLAHPPGELQDLVGRPLRLLLGLADLGLRLVDGADDALEPLDDEVDLLLVELDLLEELGHLGLQRHLFGADGLDPGLGEVLLLELLVELAKLLVEFLELLDGLDDLLGPRGLGAAAPGGDL